MQSKLNPTFVVNGDLSGTVEAVQFIGSYLNYSVYAAWTGATAAGTFNLRASNTNNGTDWEDIGGTSVVAAGPGSNFWNITDACYAFFQLVFTPSSGTGVLNANNFQKVTTE